VTYNDGDVDERVGPQLLETNIPNKCWDWKTNFPFGKGTLSGDIHSFFVGGWIFGGWILHIFV